MKLPAFLFIVTVASATLFFLFFSSPLPPHYRANDLDVTLWAKSPMLKNPVALSHDRQGRLYVTETNRRRADDLDVRGMRGLEPVPWTVLDWTLTSVAQRRAMIREYLAVGGSYNNPWMTDRNEDGQKDWHDLTVTSERVHLLEDTDGDGQADKAQVFADDFRTEVTGVAGGVLWFDDNVYFTVIPDLWMLQDEDGDGVADRREILVDGHGVHIGQGGHDLHGLMVGPDGRIYWSVGDKGINTTTEEGRNLYFPNQGVVLRSEPDGSNVEVFAHGLRNCQEMAFDDYANLFCVDNDGDFEGERERFVYVTKGSDTGWRINWQYNLTNAWAEEQALPEYLPWMDEGLSVPHFEGQAAYITPTLQNYSDGPAGFKRNPGTALSAAYEDYFFLTQFPGELITAFKVQPKGAAFEMVNEHTFYQGMMATGLSWAPDGALFVADWSGGWAPNEEGAIVRFDVSDSLRHPLRSHTEQLIREGLDDCSNDSLAALLSYPDQRVRLDAQFELVERDAGDILTDVVFQNTSNELARVHGLWGMGQLARAGLLAWNRPLELLLRDEDTEIRAQVLRFIGEAGPLLPNAEQHVIPLLTDASPRVRFHAAMVLGEVGTSAAVPPLLHLLDHNADQDPFLRHAAVMGLAGAGDAEALLETATHRSPAVRLGAVLALRRLADPRVSVFLNDTEELIVLEAARAIHDDLSIPEALPALATLIGTTSSENEALLRRVLNANLRVGKPANAQLLLNYAVNDEHPEAMQVEALTILYTWAKPPMLDRVERRYRPLPEKDEAGIVHLLEPRLPELFSTRKPGVQEAVSRLLRRYGISTDESVFIAWLEDRSLPTSIRLEALRALAEAPSTRAKAFETAYASDDPHLRANALQLHASFDSNAAYRRLETVLDEQISLMEQQTAIELLGDMTSRKARRRLKGYAAKLLKNNVLDDLRLDVLEAARANADEGLRKQAEAIVTRFGDDVAGVPSSFLLKGGDPTAGEALFLKHPAAQCARCHALDDAGSEVGPGLAGIGDRFDPAYLLESLIDPSAVLADGFQDATTSMMPPMGAILTPAELRDVVAYLAGLNAGTLER